MEESLYIREQREDQRYTQKNGKYKEYPIKEDESITLDSTAITKFEAPLPANTEVGKIIVKKGDEVIDEISIKTKETVEKKTVLEYFVDLIQLLKIVL